MASIQKASTFHKWLNREHFTFSGENRNVTLTKVFVGGRTHVESNHQQTKYDYFAITAQKYLFEDNSCKSAV